MTAIEQVRSDYTDSSGFWIKGELQVKLWPSSGCDVLSREIGWCSLKDLMSAGRASVLHEINKNA